MKGAVGRLECRHSCPEVMALIFLKIHYKTAGKRWFEPEIDPQKGEERGSTRGSKSANSTPTRTLLPQKHLDHTVFRGRRQGLPKKLYNIFTGDHNLSDL